MVFAMIGAASAVPTSHSEVSVEGNEVSVESHASNDAYKQDIDSRSEGVLRGKGTIETTSAAGGDYNSFIDRTRWTEASINLVTEDRHSDASLSSSIDADLTDSNLNSKMEAEIEHSPENYVTITGFTSAFFDQSPVYEDNVVSYNTYANMDLTGRNHNLEDIELEGSSRSSIGEQNGMVGTFAGGASWNGYRRAYTGAFVSYSFFDVFGHGN